MILISAVVSNKTVKTKYEKYEYKSKENAKEHSQEMISRGYSVEHSTGETILYSKRVYAEREMTNEQLSALLDNRLTEKGYTHPDDKSDLFLHEVFEILNG